MSEFINPTLAGAEDDPVSLTRGEDLSTTLSGEEDPIYTTLAIGEEDSGTTSLRGEEDLSTSLRGEEDGGGLSPVDPTLTNPFGAY